MEYLNKANLFAKDTHQKFEEVTPPQGGLKDFLEKREATRPQTRAEVLAIENDYWKKVDLKLGIYS